MEFQLDIDGDRRVDVRLGEFPDQVRAALRRKIERLTETLLSQVVGQEPQRTGKLRGETRPGLREGPDFIIGTVRVAAPTGAEARKAAALEYGATKPANVPAHRQSLTHVFGRQIAPLEVIVAAYRRPSNLAARHYLRGPLDAMRGAIKTELHDALEEVSG